MTSETHYVEHENLSLAWGRALQLVSAKGRNEVVPLIISITGFDASRRPKEETAVRAALDATLENLERQNCHTVANTIFPESLWNPARPRAEFFERYRRVFPKIQTASTLNRRGLYFERMTGTGTTGRKNQLEFILSTYLGRKGVRRSALQVAVFDPERDHSAEPYLSFPCLQHVTFAPDNDGLCVNAFYAVQYVVERAYGNYLGLCRLGRFVAHELDLPLKRVTCFAGVAQLDAKKADVKTVLGAVEQALAKSPAKEA
jgi:hypothetical protein